jgi:acetyl esterase/lipase
MGYLVLTFDYRGWGESDGKLMRTDPAEASANNESKADVTEVRQIVDPIDQLEDIENAYYYLIGEAAVDTERLAIWGSSLGGGLALQSAATLPGIKVLISQIGAVNPQSQPAMSDSDIRQWRIARARGDAPPFPGEESAIPGLTGNPDWPEYVRYDPFASRTQLMAATLIIDAADEELFDIAENGAALYDAIKDRLPSQYEALPGKHYDIYRDSGYQAAVKLQMEWLNTHLPITE